MDRIWSILQTKTENRLINILAGIIRQLIQYLPVWSRRTNKLKFIEWLIHRLKYPTTMLQ